MSVACRPHHRFPCVEQSRCEEEDDERLNCGGRKQTPCPLTDHLAVKHPVERRRISRQMARHH